MAKAKVKQRKDSKGRVLQKGESQRKLDGMYIYTYVNPYGKRCYVYSKDLFTLREKEQELIKAQMDGLDYYVGGHATINMTFDRYMSTKHNLRETTRSNYLYMFNRFIREDFGNKFLTEVKYTDVKLFYYHLLNEKDIAINTLDTIHTVLHPIFDMAVRDDIINKNPTDGVLAEIKRNSGKNKGIRHALTIEQQQAFMDTIRTFPEYYHWYPLFATLLGTGMRIGELCGLTIMDVDFIHEVVVIDHQLLKSKEQGYYIETPKTKSGTRQVPLSKETIQAFQRVMKKRPKAEPFVIDGRGNFLFVNQKGKPKVAIDYNMLFVRMVKKYNKQHKDNPLPHITPHTLRHTFCTRLASKNMNPKDLQYIMGHSNISITMNWYAHASIDTAKSEVQRLIA